MQTRQLSTKIWVPRPIDEVFEFFADAHNLNELTPPWLSFSILTPAPIEMRVGARIDYKIRVHGMPMRWRSEISVWDPPHRFVDEQLKGPYKLWHHEHSFQSVDGGTSISDLVQYRGRGGVLEPLIHKLFVRRDLDKIFSYRLKRLAELYDLPAEHEGASIAVQVGGR
ncbi:MAG: SRPBCC family protein [Planctomycetota bacterium]